jgi:hypothetical protein
MNKNILYILLVTALGLASCNFLDKNPDNRTEIDTKKKVRLLLVNAYDAPNYGPLCEFSSDNIIDNNTPDKTGHVNTKQPFNQGYDQIFAWQAVTAFSSQDSPYWIWNNCYKNIAVANQALDAIKKLEEAGTDMSAEKGEALICRAYNHFILVNIFGQAYKSDALSQYDLGIHYMTEAETEVNPKYTRNTVTEVYKLIEEDIQAALPLISDEYYAVPKYHFNLKAAYAFAARFYLYKRDYDKVIQYANKVLGTTATEAAAVMFDAENCKGLGNIELEMYAWMDASSQSNLLIQSTYSFALYGNLPSYCRYTLNRDPRDYTIGGSGPCWEGSFPGVSIWRYNANYGGLLSKMYEAFEYTDKVAGIGYPHSLRREFTTGETLLCRAEAEIMKGQYAAAVSDLDVWAKGYLCTKDLTDSRIKSFYYKNKNVQQTPTLRNQQMCPQWKVSETQMPYIWCVLHFRRIETMHDGLRWFDIKRYGIELTHEIGYPVKKYRLIWNDDRRAIQLPQEAIIGGQTANPRSILGDNNSPIVTGGTSVEPNGMKLWLELKAEMKNLTIDTDSTEQKNDIAQL